MEIEDKLLFEKLKEEGIKPHPVKVKIPIDKEFLRNFILEIIYQNYLYNCIERHKKG